MPIIAGKLGCKPPKPHAQARLLKLAKYLNPAQLPPPPDSTNYRANLGPLGMMLNDTIGDCVVAGMGHLQQLMSGNAGQPVIPTDAQILADYIRLTGLEGAAYNPATGANDNGVVLTDALSDWRSNGVAGNQISAYCAVDPTDHQMIVASTWLFGGLLCGWNLPRAWQGADAWTAPSRAHRFGPWAAGSWGGHCAPIVDYNDQNVFVLSWATIIPVSWAAVDMFCAESYPVIDGLWFSGDKSVSGFDAATLANDQAAVSGQQQAA